MSLTVGQITWLADRTMPLHLETILDGMQPLPLLEILWNKRQKTQGTHQVAVNAITPVTGIAWNGFTGDDPLLYIDVQSSRRAIFPIKEMQIGSALTMSMLMRNGITIAWDSVPATPTKQEVTTLENYLRATREPLMYGKREDLQNTLWGDGTLDPLKMGGVTGLVTAVAGGSVGGIPRAGFWDNRRRLGIAAADIVEVLDTERLMHLTKYIKGSFRPQHIMYCGSDAYTVLRRYVRSQVQVQSEAGAPFATAFDFGFGTNNNRLQDTLIKFGGVDVVYDPFLDLIGGTRRIYCIDHAAIQLRTIDGMDDTRYMPKSSPDQAVLFEGWFLAGNLIAKRLNTSGVYEIA